MVEFNKQARLAQLTPLQYEVTQHAATERPFTGSALQLVFMLMWLVANHCFHL